jgi:GT2 family glycosyltransferase
MNSFVDPAAPRYSILVTSYRSLRFLPELSGSLLASMGPDCEFLFLDNGSPEPEAEWMREHVRDPRVRVFKEPHTRYFAGGMNYLTKHARGEFLVMLNADTRVEPDWLEKLDASLRATGFEAVVAEIRGENDAPGSPPGFRLDRMGLVIEVPESEIAYPHRVFLACGAAFAVRRELFFEVGPLDESYRMYWEDIDLCWRLNLRGYRVGYVPGAVVYHTGGGSGRKSFFKWTHFRVIRNRILSFTKNAGPGLLVQFLLINALLRLVAFPANLLRGQFGRAFSEVAAIGSALALLGPALARRREIQATRVVSDEELARLGYIDPKLKYADWRQYLKFLPGRPDDAR